jgi:hypothetical protein
VRDNRAAQRQTGFNHKQAKERSFHAHEPGGRPSFKQGRHCAKLRLNSRKSSWGEHLMVNARRLAYKWRMMPRNDNHDSGIVQT